MPAPLRSAARPGPAMTALAGMLALAALALLTAAALIIFSAPRATIT